MSVAGGIRIKELDNDIEILEFDDSSDEEQQQTVLPRKTYLSPDDIKIDVRDR